MSTTEEETTEAPSTFVVHVASISDVHTYVGPAGEDEVAQISAQLSAASQGEFETTASELVSVGDFLAAHPVPTAAEPEEAEAEAEVSSPSAGEIPGPGTLANMSRADVDAIAVQHGLDPADYSNKTSEIEALVALK